MSTSLFPHRGRDRLDGHAREGNYSLTDWRSTLSQRRIGSHVNAAVVICKDSYPWQWSASVGMCTCLHLVRFLTWIPCYQLLRITPTTHDQKTTPFARFQQQPHLRKHRSDHKICSNVPHLSRIVSYKTIDPNLTPSMLHQHVFHSTEKLWK